MSDERKSLSTNDPWWGEHIHRYRAISPAINKTDIILDLACGTGYGTNILAGQTTNKVTGGDISQEAVNSCNATWKKENLSFRVLDGTALDFPDNYFDKVVSFETIEHTTKYHQMLSEFKRVLKPGGILFLSTPNQPLTSPHGIKNPYHTQEFTYDQLKDMLRIFSTASLQGQKLIRFDKKGVRSSWNKLVIGFLTLRGIRKIPYKIREGMVKGLTGLTLYPTDKDFDLVSDERLVKEKCPVLFATCKK